MPNKKNVVLVYRADLAGIEPVKEQITAFFAAQVWPCEVLTLETIIKTKPQALPQADLLIVLGGDGTFLTAARRYLSQQCPVVGVNAGNLGFLTRIETQALDACLNAIVANETGLESRLVLEVAETSETYALNDIVLKNAKPGQMAQIRVYDQGELITTYDADGLIIATPTGSTAYNLSAGGPIIVPGSEVYALTPICPHSLSAKAIILPSSTQLRIEASATNSSSLILAMDGETVNEIPPGQSIQVGVSKYKLPLVCFNTDNESFYALLKRKLNWSDNPRKGHQLNSLR